MKKFLAALLAVLMVLSTLATCIVAVGAEGGSESNKEVVHRVTMSDADASVEGWLTGTPNAMLPLATPDSLGCVALTFEPGQIDFAKLVFRYSTEDAGTPSYDITKYTYCVFDFYISDADLLKKDNAAGAQINFELTAGGTQDQEEGQVTGWMDGWEENGVQMGWIEGGLQDGWNKVKIPLDSLTENSEDPFDRTKWNFLRFFNNNNENNPIVAPEGLTVAIDNFGFCNDTETLIVDKCDPDLNGWSGSANAIQIDKLVYDEEKGEDVAVVQNAMGCVLNGTYKAKDFQLIWNAPENAVNISGMKYIEFDLYVSDPAVLPNARNLWIELGSAGKEGEAIAAYELYMGENNSMGLKQGWNHVQLGLDLFTRGAGGFDYSNLNYFRFYLNNGSPFTVTDFTIAIDNVTFWDGMEDLKLDKNGNLAQGRETITFKPNTAEETPYQYKRDEWKLDGSRSDHYRANGTDGFMLQFPIENAETAQSVIFSAVMGGQILLSVSTDGEHWEEAYRFEDAKAEADNTCPNNRKKSWHAFDLTEFVVDEDGGLLGDTVYIKIADSLHGKGWGGMLFWTENVALDVIYDIPGFDKTDSYSFVVGTEKEKEYLVNEGSGLTETLRYADGNAEIIYKYPLERTEHLDRVSWGANIQGQYVISVSTDGTTWTEIDRWVSGSATDKVQTKLLDLSAGVDMSGTVEAIWVKVSDAVPTDGQGGAIANTRATTLQVTYYNAEAIVNEEISFTVGTDAELNYLINGDGKGGDYANNKTLSRIHDNGSVRFADTTRYFTYVYDISDYTSIRGLTWSAKIGAWYHVWASADGENWEEIYKADEKKAAAVVPFDLSPVLKNAVETGKLYVKIGDAVTTDGYGGAVYTDTPVVLKVAHIPLTDEELDAIEMTGDEHSRPLWGCNENWPDDDPDEPHGWVLDMENQTAGSGCLSLEIDPSDYNAGGIKLPAPVSGVGMDTLEFELYLSDLAILEMDKANINQIELSSSGTMDTQEWSFNWETMFAYIQGEPQVGWNHVAIPMDKASQKDATFRLDNINWIRFYHNPSKKVPSGWIIKIDNIRLTDAIKYAEEEAQREQEALLNKHADLIAEIDALNAYKTSTSITEENYETARAEILAIREKVNALPENELQVLTDAKALRPLTNAEKTLADYEEDAAKDKQTLEENKALLDEIDALSVYATITEENCEAAEAAIKAAREKYELLKKSVRNLLEEKGYLAKIEAAEAALDAFKPSVDPGTNVPNGNTTPGDSGCQSALTVGAGAMMLLAAAWVSIATRKKED